MGAREELAREIVAAVREADNPNDAVADVASRLPEIRDSTVLQGANFCRVFELPDKYPSGYLFGGGVPVAFRMVDWFEPWPRSDMYLHELPRTWAQVKAELLPFLQAKHYIKPGKRYVLITEFGESMTFEGGTE